MATERFANTAQTTLSAAVTNTTSPTTITVSATTGFPSTGPFRIRVERELMLVTAVAGTTWTVTRGTSVDGTVASTHPQGALVTQVLTANALAALMTPVGTVTAFTGLTIPDGWLLCDGASVSRTTYADLFATLAVVLTGTTTNGSPTVTGLTSTASLFVGLKVAAAAGIPAGAVVAGTSPPSTITLGANATATGSRDLTFSIYGVLDTTTFYLPNFLGRALIGDGTGSGLQPRVIGQTLGVETVALNLTQIPAHSHTPPSPYEVFFVRDVASTSGNINVSWTLGSVDGWVTNTETAGGGGSHENMQPSAVVKWIIKT